MKHRQAYRAIRVNHVDWTKLSQHRPAQRVVLGMDVVHWPDGRFERPWRGDNPGEVATWTRLLREVRQGRELVVAVEPFGVYGDAFRQAGESSQIGSRLQRIQ
jgi:hypothetical protein